MESVWIVIIASLVAVNCSLWGSYLVLRKNTMISDAIAHSVLPGIFFAFLITGSKSPFFLILGAGTIGLGATFLMEFLEKKIKISLDASIGLNFTWLFALGVILISLYSKKVDLDPDCVLYGEIAYAPMDVFTTNSGINLGPRALYVMLCMLILSLSFISIFYKELYITTFDSAFADSIGYRSSKWHYAIMAGTSFTTVAAFEVVGVALVVALIVTPAATAYLLTTKLPTMLALASLFGVIASIGGYTLAVLVNGSIAGAIATFAGAIFFLVFIYKKLFKTKRIL